MDNFKRCCTSYTFDGEYRVLRGLLLHRSSINNSASLSNKFGGFYFIFKFGISGLLHQVVTAMADRIRGYIKVLESAQDRDVGLGEADSETSSKGVYEESFSRHTSLPEPKSSPLVEDHRIDEPIVQDLNVSPSLQVSAPDEGYPKSVKEARGHPIEHVIAELMKGHLGTWSRLCPYHFIYPERSLKMKEMLYKFIDEGKREHEEMRAFIYVHDNNTDVQPEEPPVIDPDKPVGSNEVLTENQPQKTNEPFVQPSREVQTPPVPFLRRLRKEKEEAQQKKFLENLKQLHINLPFIEALAQMPKYAKFLKSLLTNKARLEESCKVTMNERCYAVLLNKLPSKEKDPGSFTIPCDIGQLHIDNALADLEASISLMSPFLATARAMIDVFNKKITLRVGDDEVIFYVDRSIKRPTTEDDECYGIDDLDDTINKEFQELPANEEPDSFLSGGLEKSIEQSDI
ncbi:hypothetical protein Tco_1217466 [Tanacetum coccineum]